MLSLDMLVINKNLYADCQVPVPIKTLQKNTFFKERILVNYIYVRISEMQ
jgi:hypothetical protein